MREYKNNTKGGEEEKNCELKFKNGRDFLYFFFLLKYPQKAVHYLKSSSLILVNSAIVTSPTLFSWSMIFFPCYLWQKKSNQLKKLNKLITSPSRKNCAVGLECGPGLLNGSWVLC